MKPYSTPQLRHLAPDDALAKVWPDARSRYGISRVADITGLDRLGVPVFQAYRPGASLGNLSISSGKGESKSSALLGAVMEAAERHYAEYTPDRLLRLASYEQMVSEVGGPCDVLDPRDLHLHHASVWSTDTVCEWVRAEPVGKDHPPAWIVADAVFTPYRAPQHRLFGSYSHGLSAGSTQEEAVVHSLIELFERDAHSFGLHAGASGALDPMALGETTSNYVRALDKEGIHTQFIAHDAHDDQGVFTVEAVTVDHELQSTALIAGGIAAAFDPRTASRAALLEAIQSRACIIAGSREDFTYRHRPQLGVPFEQAVNKLQARIDKIGNVVNKCPEPAAVHDLPSAKRRLLAALRAIGVDKAYVVELTPPGSDVRVVRVIAPGMEFTADEPGRVGRRMYRRRSGFEG